MELVPNAVNLANVHKVKGLEKPVVMHERMGGTSSIGSWKNAYYMINVILSILLSRKGVR